MACCPVTDQAVDAAGYPAAAASSAAVAAVGPDSGPQPRRRGSYRGFLPETLAADLRTSAASGAGLALIQEAPAPAPAGNSAALGIGALALLAFL